MGHQQYIKYRGSCLSNKQSLTFSAKNFFDSIKHIFKIYNIA